METIEFENIEGFNQYFEELKSKRKEENPNPGQGGVIKQSKFLLRGVPNSDWSLETTLERSTHRLHLFHYLELIKHVQRPIETFCEEKWEIPDLNVLHRWQRDEFVEVNLASIFDYLVFLRHHGFPSPFLDWTFSPYIAQFFAFNHTQSKHVAIYIYQKTKDGMSTDPVYDPVIRTFSPIIGGRTARHFLQHSIYTFSTIYNDKYGWMFSRHEKVSEMHIGTPHHQVIKCIIPSSERNKVLKNLDDHSLNSFSLFQTTDSLMDSLSIRYLGLRDLNN